MQYNKKNKNYNKISNQVWVGVLNYKNHSNLFAQSTDDKLKSLPRTNLPIAMPINLLTNLRLETWNKLIGLEEHKQSYWIGTYKGIDYIITTTIKILTRKISSPFKPNILKKGIKLQLKGRLRGVSKANSFKLSVGNVRTHTFDNMIDYCEKPIQTKWGIFGMKIFLN